MRRLILVFLIPIASVLAGGAFYLFHHLYNPPSAVALARTPGGGDLPEKFGRWWGNLAKTVLPCSVREKTIPLTEKWSEINPRLDEQHPPCRVVGDPFGSAIEFRDGLGRSYPAVEWDRRDALAVRSVRGTATFKYSLCPTHLNGKLDYYCRPQSQTARR